MLLHNRFDFLLRQPRHQAFSNARGMQKHPPPHPGVYLEKSWRLDFLDVHGFALVQDCKMNGEVNLFYKRSHERQGYSGEIEISLGVTAETQNFQPEAVAGGFRIAPQITAPFQSAENVAGGTFWNSQFAADFRIGKSVAALRGGFENIQSAFDGGCRAGIGACHSFLRIRKICTSQV